MFLGLFAMVSSWSLSALDGHAQDFPQLERMLGVEGELERSRDLSGRPALSPSSTQGIGLRPRPWAGISRPVGPDRVPMPVFLSLLPLLSLFCFFRRAATIPPP